MDDVLQEQYYTYCRNYLSPFGLWPLQNAKSKILLRTCMLLAVFTVFIPHLSKAYELRHHFHYFILCIPSIIYYIQYLTKFLYMIAKNSKCRDLLERIRLDFQTYGGDRLEILHHYAEEGRKLNNIYVCYLFTAVIMFNVSAFTPLMLDVLVPLNETRPRPPPRLMKYNIKRFDESFFMKTLHGFVFDIVVIILVLGFDTLLVNCSQHACALFRISAYELEHTLDSSGKVRQTDESLENKSDVFYGRIVKSIVTHKRALEFVEMLESTYSIANLLIIGITLLSMTLTEFEIVQHKGQTEIMFRFIMFAMGEMLHTLFHNFPGQKIKDHSLIIYQFCYDCQWYRQEVSSECKKLIGLMMMRSQKPSCLTGGGLYVLGYENYATILKASLSYFTFLSSV